MENTMNINNVIIDSEVADTVIGPETRFKGSINTDRPIRIDGIYEGDIDSSVSVIISETGKFNGVLRCAKLFLYGYAQGEVVCGDLFTVTEKGEFNGKITTANLITVKGSTINGTLVMKK